jgi:hypothetical protein
VTVSCCLAAQRGLVSIGSILEICYHPGTLQKRSEINSEEFCLHISYVLESCFILNNTIRFQGAFKEEKVDYVNQDPRSLSRSLAMMMQKRSLSEFLGLSVNNCFIFACNLF